MSGVEDPVEIDLERDDPGDRSVGGRRWSRIRPVRRASTDASPATSAPSHWRGDARLRRGVVVLVVVGAFVAGVVVGRSDPVDDIDSPGASVPVDRDDGAGSPGGDPGDGFDADPTPVPGVEDLGRPLLPGPTGLVLVGVASSGDLVEVDIDRGTIRRTRVADGWRPDVPPTVVATDAATLVVDRSGPRPMAHVVPVGEPARDALDLIEGQIGRPPRAGRGASDVWLSEIDGAAPPGAPIRLRLVDVLTGDEIGVVPPLEPLAVEAMYPDRVGGLLLVGVGGTYEVGRAVGDAAAVSPVRIAPGRLVGVGRSHVVVRECDERLRCETVRIDRGTGVRVSVDIGDRAGRGYWAPDLVSPDGTTMVGVGIESTGRTATYELVDLGTGATTTIGATTLPRDAVFDTSSVAWSADGRFVLFLADHSVAYHDTLTGQGGRLGGRDDGGDGDGGGDGRGVVPELLTVDVRHVDDPGARAGADPDAAAGPADQLGSSSSSARSAAVMSSRASATMRLR